jgi:hypothetical protein
MIEEIDMSEENDISWAYDLYFKFRKMLDEDDT